MSVFSPALDAKLTRLAEAYPRRRSALVPMLLYAQDELGWLTPEAVREIAERLGETELAVRETISYYSMLRTHPVGRYHVQVCTNISCLLRGGEELLQHCRKRLGLEQCEVTPDGMFSIEEVECIGACSWAPALQVNYDFHQNLDPARADQVLAEYRQKA